jgi:putative ABC transport system permease protein
MLKNYFLVALRNFWRNKVFALINILGLAIGISAALVIFLIVDYDFSFDHFEKGRDRIYRVGSDFTSGGQTSHWGDVCAPMPAAIQKEMTGIELVAPFTTWDETKVTIPYPDANHPAVLKKQKDQVYVDERYFSLIHYDWLAGSPATALREPYQVVLTEKNAHLFFPGLSYQDIVGKSIVFNDSIRVLVKGVVKDIAHNTDFNFGTFVSRATLETTRLKPQGFDSWGNTNSADQVFLRLSPGTTTQQVISQLNHLLKEHREPDPDNHSSILCNLQPLSELHFDALYGAFDNSRTAHKPTLYGLLAVAAFLLLLACINFINLTTAQASQRAKEIGIRKTLGGQRSQLTLQFLSETFLLTLIATLLSIAIAPLLLKVFADFIPPDLHFSLSGQPQIILFLLALIALVSLLSGCYPALVMSAYRPIQVLKNQSGSNTGRSHSAWIRKSLTVSQFVIAQIFIIATILVGKQISYALNKDLGFKKEAIFSFRTKYNGPKTKRDLLMEKMKAIPGIAMISLATDPPSNDNEWGSTMKYNDGKKQIVQDVQIKKADTAYLRLFGFHLLAGANFTQSDTTNSLLINENFAHILGFTDPSQAVGKQIDWAGGVRIAGVIADFHPKSLRYPIGPVVIANAAGDGGVTFNVALQPQNADGTAWTTTLGRIQKAFKSVYPEDDFDYEFVDDTIAKFYTAEKNISRLLIWATGLAIFISCLGLLGLAIYITNRRTKEIGIRKVIGATVTQIVVLISNDFMKLIALAILIALPIAWWGSNKWLENFVYRTTLSWWVFAVSGLLLVLFALVTLCIQTIRAAAANPVDGLRAD